MSIPLAPVPIPDRVHTLARGARLTPVWANELGGLTFRTDDDRFIKWGPRNPEVDAAAEAERLVWAAAYTRVPHVLDAGHDATEEWLVTAALAGRSAADPRWIAEPATAVRAVGAGLRILHDALPVEACPFEWSVPTRIENAAGRGIRLPDALHAAPPIDARVVCHGDACVPNTLLDDGGDPVAHVDLGSLGVADRWADIAVAAMSTEWNYGPGWHDVLIEAYAIEPDRERLAYYRDLWNAT
jgi:kanamycin kinase